MFQIQTINLKLWKEFEKCGIWGRCNISIFRDKDQNYDFWSFYHAVKEWEASKIKILINLNLDNIFAFFYINRKKYWFRENFRIPVFDGFTRFRVSWTRFDYFWKMSLCVWQKFCAKCNSRTNAQNFMKFYISCS